MDRKGGIKLPAPPPLEIEEECEKCGKHCYLRDGKRGPWIGCSAFPKCRGRVAYSKLPDERKEALEKALGTHLKANPQPELVRKDGTPITEGMLATDLLVPGGSVVLEIHPDAEGDHD